MRKATWVVSAALTLALALPVSALAAPISFWSGDGSDVVTPGAVTVITPHAAWGDVSDDAGLLAGTADWISYADTGAGGIVAPNVASRSIGNQTALFTRTFNISSNDGLSGLFHLWVLADDTATVVFNGPGHANDHLFDAFPTQVDPCAPGNSGGFIGCTEISMGVKALTGLANGVYTMSVYAFQTNGSVFGAQYAGNFSTADAVPEPATLILLGTGLVGLSRIRKTRKLA